MCLSLCQFSKKANTNNKSAVATTQDPAKMKHFLIGDIGGTNSRLQLVEVSQKKSEPVIIKS